MQAFRNLDTHVASHINKIKRPPLVSKIDSDSAALEILTDFSVQSPETIRMSASITEALELMKSAHVKLQLVVNTRDDFEGVITLSDLQSVKVTRAQEERGLRRADLTVADIMTTKQHLHIIGIREYSRANVGDILLTMQQYGEQHVLVADIEENCICGIVSASDIARKMRVPVLIAERANTFSEIYEAVHP